MTQKMQMYAPGRDTPNPQGQKPMMANNHHNCLVDMIPNQDIKKKKVNMSIKKTGFSIGGKFSKPISREDQKTFENSIRDKLSLRGNFTIRFF